MTRLIALSLIALILSGCTEDTPDEAHHEDAGEVDPAGPLEVIFENRQHYTLWLADESLALSLRYRVNGEDRMMRSDRSCDCSGTCADQGFTRPLPVPPGQQTTTGSLDTSDLLTVDTEDCHEALPLAVGDVLEVHLCWAGRLDATGSTGASLVEPRCVSETITLGAQPNALHFVADDAAEPVPQTKIRLTNDTDESVYVVHECRPLRWAALRLDLEEGAEVGPSPMSPMCQCKAEGLDCDLPAGGACPPPVGEEIAPGASIEVSAHGFVFGVHDLGDGQSCHASRLWPLGAHSVEVCIGAGVDTNLDSQGQRLTGARCLTRTRGADQSSLEFKASEF